MKTVRARFAIAISITLMNICVTLWCGPLLWGVWGGIPIARIGLLLFAGVGAFTLMDIWSQTIGLLPNRWSTPILTGRGAGISTLEETMEGADV